MRLDGFWGWVKIRLRVALSRNLILWIHGKQALGGGNAEMECRVPAPGAALSAITENYVRSGFCGLADGAKFDDLVCGGSEVRSQQEGMKSGKAVVDI